MAFMTIFTPLRASTFDINIDSVCAATQGVEEKVGGCFFKMSGEDYDAAAVAEEKLHCASCGIAQVDDIKLFECNSCDLARYCSDDCQENHKSEHEEDCKKRAAELRDELLFKQPESTHLGDCPICMIPLPLDEEKISFRFCCCNFVCEGCMHQSFKREMEERRRYPECPFCREPTPTGDNMKSSLNKLSMKRVKAKDPVAMCLMGGDLDSKGDHIGAFEWFTKAAELGHVEAHYQLSILYEEGHGVEKDSGKEIHHLEVATIGGHPGARHNLAVLEFNEGSRERAGKHWIIAATQGQDESIESLMNMFKLEGIEGGRRSVSKEDLAAALRGHQAAVEAYKSPQREAAAAFHGRNRHLSGLASSSEQES
jgi:hypothetical protein